MTRRTTNRISGLILLAGFASAIAIYFAAEPPVDNALLNDPRAARKLNHDLRVMGGKANVLASDFQDWFASLWEGRTLAGTVAVVTVGVTLIYRFVASFPPPPGKDPRR